MDVLEELLSEQEEIEKEKGSVFPQPRPGLWRKERKGPEKPTEAGERAQETARSSAPPPERGGRREEAEAWPSVIPSGTGAADPLMPWERAPVPDLEAELREKHRAAGYRASAPDRRGTALLPPKGEEARPGLGPEELDGFFQRDARRYDGAFPLY